MTPGDQLRIIDLGLSFRISPSEVSVLRPFAGKYVNLFFLLISDHHEHVQGTPEYMPPEVCQIQNGHYSRQGRASDIWALGLYLIVVRQQNKGKNFLSFS